jgi:PilZ domain
MNLVLSRNFVVRGGNAYKFGPSQDSQFHLPFRTIDALPRHGRISNAWRPARGRFLGNAPLSGRKEPRIPAKMFVSLYSPDQPSFELASTLDVSCHGARVVTKTRWEPNQHLSVRSIRGNLYSRARVVHCRRHTFNTFIIGLEMFYPEGDWVAAAKPSTA